MSIRSRLLAPIIIIALFGGILLARSAGLWKTEASKVPVTFTSGEYEGENNPGDIRGSYSMGDIAGAFDVEVSVLVQAFGLKDQADPGNFQVKQLEEIYGDMEGGAEIGTDAVRLFVARYTGLPYIPEATTRIPFPALNVLKEKLSTADFEALTSIAVGLTDLKNSTGTASDTSEQPETEAGVIKGGTTFNDLLSWGMTEKEIEDIIGMPAGPRSAAVREYIMEQGLEFFSYKEKLQAALDSK